MMVISHDLGVVAAICDTRAGDVRRRHRRARPRWPSFSRTPAHPYSAALLRLVPRLDQTPAPPAAPDPGAAPDVHRRRTRVPFRCRAASTRPSAATKTPPPSSRPRRSVTRSVLAVERPDARRCARHRARSDPMSASRYADATPCRPRSAIAQPLAHREAVVDATRRRGGMITPVDDVSIDDHTRARRSASSARAAAASRRSGGPILRLPRPTAGSVRSSAMTCVGLEGERSGPCAATCRSSSRTRGVRSIRR